MVFCDGSERRDDGLGILFGLELHVFEFRRFRKVNQTRHWFAYRQGQL